MFVGAGLKSFVDFEKEKLTARAEGKRFRRV